MFWKLLLAALLLVALVGPASPTGHWPDVPLIDTSCERIQRGFPDSAISTILYNSVTGMLVLSYEFADGTLINVVWDVQDLVHEEAADYSIKLSPYPIAY